MNYSGKCLIARPNLNQELFENSVVFIYEHNWESICGLILNKKSHYNTQSLFEHKSFQLPLKPEPVYRGGPVNTKAVLLLHSNDWRSTNTMMINKDLSVSSDNLMMQKFENQDIPTYHRFFSGGAVWHQAQLEEEIHQGCWLIGELSSTQIFETNGLAQWDVAIETAAKQAVDNFF